MVCRAVLRCVRPRWWLRLRGYAFGRSYRSSGALSSRALCARKDAGARSAPAYRNTLMLQAYVHIGLSWQSHEQRLAFGNPVFLSRPCLGPRASNDRSSITMVHRPAPLAEASGGCRLRGAMVVALMNAMDARRRDNTTSLRAASVGAFWRYIFLVDPATMPRFVSEPWRTLAAYHCIMQELPR